MFERVSVRLVFIGRDLTDGRSGSDVQCRVSDIKGDVDRCLVSMAG